MNPALIAQLLIVLAPLIKDAVVEGGKLVTTFRDNISQEDLNKALEASKSLTWPELTFK
jgi:hypothetical protein